MVTWKEFELHGFCRMGPLKKVAVAVEGLYGIRSVEVSREGPLLELGGGYEWMLTFAGRCRPRAQNFLKRALLSAKRLDDPDLLTDGCILAWNVGTTAVPKTIERQ
jgi:hypothetical protein